MIITIDGPSGSGKTTLALMIAKQLNFFCLNTGYLYRGLAYVLKNFYGYDTQHMRHPDKSDIDAIFQSGNLRYEYEYGLVKIYWVDNISVHLKDPEISKFAAFLGQHAPVRDRLRIYEHSLAQNKDSVIEGRACGSVIYPQAEVKFYLDAVIDVRAARLQQDQMKRGNLLTLHEALEQIKMRDTIDYTRSIEPLKCPEDAIVLDSSQASPDQLLEIALEYVKKEMPKSV